MSSIFFGAYLLRIGVVPKFSSPEALALAKKILEYADSKGAEVYLDKRARKVIEWDRIFSVGTDKVDAIIVVGGDGTVLNTLHLLGEDTTPIATIRYGRRGFLCDVPPFEYGTLIDRLLEGNYRVSRYMRLQAIYEELKIPYALNEFAIVTSGEARAKVARVSVKRDGDELFYLVGDGVIIAPPVGSTAYSLAAGGPVVDPEMEAIIVTPLNPITFCSRPVVLQPSSQVVVSIAKDSPNMLLIADGAFTVKLKPRDTITVRKAPTPAYFIRLYMGDYYVRLFERCM
ncbi:MAG: hypothetical protein DRO10_00475 [Thermoprotei archaeon]|nr:MAG: hypothetical protein DRO10_00475 [Thermoprotei archaeon]